jgi:putative ABC transport system substrate-binding protein
MSKLKLIIGFLVIVLVIVAVYFLIPRAEEEPQEVYRVGILSGLAFAKDTTDGFKAGMAELGYIEGQNIIYDLQETDFDMAVYRSVLNKFVEDKVDLIFVFPTEASQEAKAATQGTDIPVVFSVANIEGTGLVKSIVTPGGNMTGVRYPGPDIALQRLELLYELVPEIKKILIPYQRGYPIVASQLELLYSAAEELGITLVELPADDAAGVANSLQQFAMPGGGATIDAILLIPEPLGVTDEPFLELARFAGEHEIPIGGALMIVDGYSSLFDIGINHYKTGEQAAPLADKVFKGTPAGTIMVISSDTFLKFNLGLAQKLGLEVSEGILERAEEIIP